MFNCTACGLFGQIDQFIFYRNFFLTRAKISAWNFTAKALLPCPQKPSVKLGTNLHKNFTPTQNFLKNEAKYEIEIFFFESFISIENQPHKNIWHKTLIKNKNLYHVDFEKRGGCDVVARERHERHFSQ